jgi:alanine racemase
MTRPTKVTIDLDAIRENYQLARRVHGAHALAVVKANAYGHGAVECATVLAAHADAFGVAFTQEAVELRASGISNPILVLEGVFDETELELASELDLWVVVHQDEQLKLLEQSQIERRLHVWLKLDSGMHRAGFPCEQAREVYRRLISTGNVAEITLMTHFACADELNSAMTEQQIARFDAATADLPGDRSLANSAGLLWWPRARREWARPGLMMYGIAPQGNELPHLVAAMTFTSQIFAVRDIQAGEPIGYGATFVATRTMRVGIVCAGYADGYPQTAATGTPIAVNGLRTSLVGRVSMDMLMVDLTNLPSVGIGSDVELWGPTIRVTDVAKAAGRIAYELVCNVKRAPRVYRDRLSDLDQTSATGQWDSIRVRSIA